MVVKCWEVNMNVSPKSSLTIGSNASNIKSNEAENNVGEVSETISQENVEIEVSNLSKLSNSITDLFEKTKDYVDRKIDARDIMNNADKIVEKLANTRDKYLPREEELNQEVASFIVEFQNEKKDRENVVNCFINKLQVSYDNEIESLNSLQDIDEKTFKLEEIAMKYTAIGQKIGEMTKMFDDTTSSKITLMLSKSNFPWIEVGFLSHRNSILSLKIEFCQNEVNSAVTSLNNRAFLSAAEIVNLESKISLTQKIISDLKIEQRNLTFEIVKKGLGGLASKLEKGEKIISTLLTSGPIKDGLGMFVDISIASHGALLGGAVISLAAKAYRVAQSSDQLITLKQNIETLTKEYEKEVDPYKGVLLKAKLNRLEVVEKEVSIELAQNVMQGVVASLAICTSVEALLLAAGVTLTAATSLCLSATGIGAAVLGTAVTVGGMAYSAYVNRHEIRHTLLTADIAPRKLFLEYQLHKELQIYEEANKIFKELSSSIEVLQIGLSTALKGKDDLDKRREEGAIKQQSGITGVWLSMKKELEGSVEQVNKATAVMQIALPRIEQLKTELAILSKRKEVEDTLLASKTLASRFSNYDIHGVMSVHKIIKEGLEKPEIKIKIKDLMLAHRYPCVEPLLPEQVFDFIMDSEQVLKQHI